MANVNMKASHAGSRGALLSKRERALCGFVAASLEAAPRPRSRGGGWVTGKFVLFLPSSSSPYSRPADYS